MQNKRWMDRKTAAAELGISLSTLVRLIKSGTFGEKAVVKLGRRVLISTAVIDNLADYIKPIREKKNYDE
ncbi:hypothetical protein AGMMS49546_16720 [Spirochaetia bacterium]|nr:hypothetical protein AGMMS49546_16720 [Spirochaetia bacterium]